MNIASFAQSFASWSDLVSLALLSITVLSNGLDPIYPLWGYRWHQHALYFVTMAVLVVFSAFRFIIEGVHSVTAPRQFLTISVLYAARWLYLYYTLHCRSNRPCRYLRVAKAISRLANLRAGRSSHPSRRGQREIVVRKGTRKATGPKYWRGVIENEEHVGNATLVYLLDEGMHMDLLSPIATTKYARDHTRLLEDFYTRIYDSVMTVEGANDSYVDWTDFLGRYSAIGKTNFAVRAGATEDGDLAGVARRIAADACNYVSGRGEFRTEFQVKLMNICIEKAAEELVRNLGAQAE